MTSVSSSDSSAAVLPPAIQKVPVSLDSKGRVRTSKEQRRMILAEFERSGVSAVQFARRTGLKYSTLAGWVQRYRSARPRKVHRPLRLVEAVVEAAKGTVALPVHLPGGARMELTQVEQVQLAVAVLGALAKSC